MTWLLPTPLLLFAGVVALWPLAAIVCRPTSATRLVIEAFVTTLAVIGIVWAAWIALWLIEQRWRARVIVRFWLRMTLRVPPARWPLPAWIRREKAVPSRMRGARRSPPAAVIAPGPATA